MTKRIATQLAEEIEWYKGFDEESDAGVFTTLPRETLARWHRWAKQVDARMRLDGSEKNKRKKSAR